MRKNILFKAISLTVVMLMAPVAAHAISMTGYELIVDPEPFEAFGRDLTRTRSSAGFFEVETNDGTIQAENNVDSDFGIVNNRTVTYKHDLNWVLPEIAEITAVRLTIEAWGAIGNDEQVFADTLNLGSIPGFNIFSGNGLFSTGIFASVNPTLISGVLADNMLNITIDKNQGAGFFGNLNASSIWSSKLEIQYDAKEVPEPASLMLLGSGLAAFGMRRRRKAQA